MVANFQSENSPTALPTLLKQQFLEAGFPFACFHSLADVEVFTVFDIKKMPVKSAVDML